ncbi:MAG TPA: PAS domain S-box protein, partial [Segetibacter sp.]
MDFTAFEATPGISVIVYPDAPKYTHAAVSNDFIGATGMQREDIVGKGHFELFPKSPDDPNFTGEVNLRASFEFIVNHKKPHAIEVQRYDVPNGKGTFTQKYWNIKNAPILSRDGEVLFIVHTAIDITNQVVAEQNAETSKGIEKAYNFFMAAPVIIGYLKGDNYLIELANEGLLEVWAKTPEVIGKPLLEVIPGLEAQGFKDILDNVRNTGEPFYAYELPITLLRHGTEEVLYFDFVYKALFNGDTKTKASGVISVGLDVTEKVLIRNKIKESDEKYRTIFNTMEQGFCIIEMLFDENNKPVDYLFIETNLVFEKQTGLKNAVGKTALQLVPGLENYFVERYAKVAVTGEPIHFIEGSKAMGRWFEVDAFAIGTGGSHRVATLFTDISDRKKAEEDLKQSERNLQFTMDVIPQMVWVTLADGFHDFYNKQWYDYTGLTLEETKGTAWNLVLHPDDQERAWQIWNKCLETGEAYEIEYRLRRFDNCYRWFLGRALPFKDEAGKILKWVGTCTDIHDQKKAAEVMEGLVKERTSELEMTIRELERSNANLEEFAYAASHDLKEPIRKIRTFSERLKS